MKHSLRKYVSVEEIFNRVQDSLKSYADSDMITISSYYKVIDYCNSLMGMNVNPTKEAFIDLYEYSAELPEDFLLLDLALIVGEQVVIWDLGEGKKETLTTECATGGIDLSDPCCRVHLSCDNPPVLVCETEKFTYEFKQVFIARLTEKKYATEGCVNLNNYYKNPLMMEIRNGNIFVDNVKSGMIFIQYTAAMNNKDNIPTCLNHPIALKYYEDAVKYEIMKDLYINKRLEVAQALPLLEKELMRSKNAAISLSTTQEFTDIMNANNALKRDFRKRNHYIY